MTEQQPGARSLAVSIAAPFVASAIGSAATRRSVGAWYESLEKPEWNPPRWVFGPVWTTLYLAMGVASWLVWRDRASERRAEERAVLGEAENEERSGGHTLALGVYGVQLVLNATWSVLFFGARRPRIAFLEIVALWSAILATVVAFGRVRRAGRCAARAVPVVVDVCDGAQRGDMAPQPLATGRRAKVGTLRRARRVPRPASQPRATRGRRAARPRAARRASPAPPRARASHRRCPTAARHRGRAGPRRAG